MTKFRVPLDGLEYPLGCLGRVARLVSKLVSYRPHTAFELKKVVHLYDLQSKIQKNQKFSKNLTSELSRSAKLVVERFELRSELFLFCLNGQARFSLNFLLNDNIQNASRKFQNSTFSLFNFRSGCRLLILEMVFSLMIHKS